MGINISLLGQRIRSARQDKGMDLSDLAIKVEITPESLGHIERGIRKPSLSTLILIADELDVSLDYLTGRTQQGYIHSLSETQKQVLSELVDAVMPIVKRVGDNSF